MDTGSATSGSGDSPESTGSAPDRPEERGHSGDHPPAAVDAPSQRRRRVAWIAAGLFVFGSVVVWLWILFIYDPGRLIDELPDPTFPRAAEEICAAADDEIAHLPPAQATEDPVERASVIDRANRTLTVMIDDLEVIAPTAPPESAEAVSEWLGDWRTHLSDRQRYADRLRTDRDARFTETTKGSKQVSRAIDGFAEVNHMPSCGTPGDV